MHIEKGIINVIDGFDDGRAKGDVVNKVPVHDIEVNPVSTTADRTLRFLLNSGKIRGKQRRSDDDVGVLP